MLNKAKTLKGYRLDNLALATLKPTTLLAVFNTPQLKAVAQEVEDTIVKIMQAAAG